MSIRAVGWVLDESPVQEARNLLVLIALADRCNEQDEAYPSVGDLARRGRMSDRSVQRALRELEDGGHIVKVGTHPRGMTVWRLIMGPGRRGKTEKPEPEGGVSLTPLDSVAGDKLTPGGDRATSPGGVTAVSPEPSVEPSSEPYSPGTTSAGVRASARDSGLQTHDGEGEEADDVALAEYVRGVLQRGVDSLTTTEQVRPPSRQAVLKALREHPVDPFDAKTIAADVRAIVQAQNRAPNVVGLYAKRLAEHAERHRMPPAA